jgi:hypothetical protein
MADETYFMCEPHYIHLFISIRTMALLSVVVVVAVVA